ncbi:receptor-like protein kinase ANXUR2, partial [Trifolium pratense]
WEWRRQLRAWEEEMLGECSSLLLNISLQAHSSDRWQWRPDPDTGYSVRGTYQLLTSHVWLLWTLRIISFDILRFL